MLNFATSHFSSKKGLDHSKKGFIIFIVLGVIMVVAVLATVSLRVISNQARLTHHQVSRIQAQYAAKAGMVYALDMLRRGVWKYSPGPVPAPVNSCPNPGGCIIPNPPNPTPPPPNIFPASVRSVTVIFCPAGGVCAGSTCNPPASLPASNQFCINTTTDYLYTP